MKNIHYLIACLCMTAFWGCAASKPSQHFEWKSGWIYGNTPPRMLWVAKECPHSVAEVKTDYQLHGGMGLGMYAPTRMSVICVDGLTILMDGNQERLLTVSKNAPDEMIAETFEKAAERAIKEDTPIYIMFN